MQRTPSSGIGLFLLLTLLLSCVFYVPIIATGHLAAGKGMYVSGVMWCPGIAALLTCYLRGESAARLGWRWGAWRWQWLAYLVPLAYAAAAYAIVWSTGLGGFGNPEFVDGLGPMLGWSGAPGWVNATAYFLLLGSVGLARSMANALGEEIGWRGFLAPALVARLGFTGGALVTGAIWGGMAPAGAAVCRLQRRHAVVVRVRLFPGGGAVEQRDHDLAALALGQLVDGRADACQPQSLYPGFLYPDDGAERRDHSLRHRRIRLRAAAGGGGGGLLVLAEAPRTDDGHRRCFRRASHVGSVACAGRFFVRPGVTSRGPSPHRAWPSRGGSD